MGDWRDNGGEFPRLRLQAVGMRNTQPNGCRHGTVAKTAEVDNEKPPGCEPGGREDVKRRY